MVIDRIILDNVKAGHNEPLLEFLKDTRFSVVNGRVTPQVDNFTCVSTRGKSIVDYFIVPHDQICACYELQVDLPTDLVEQYNCINLLSEHCKLPDHSMLTLKYALNYGDKPTDNRSTDTQFALNFEMGSTNLISFKKYKFENIPDGVMENNQWNTCVGELIGQFSNRAINQQAVDELYNNMCNIVLSEMDIHLHAYSSSGNKRKRKNCKPYWTDELSDKWKMMRIAEQEFVKCQGPREVKTEKRLVFLDKRRSFDKSLRNSERVYRYNKMLEIEVNCTQNPKNFWEMIRNLGPPRRNKIPMKVKVGDILDDSHDTVLSVWRDQFEKLYNPGNQSDFNEEFLDEAMRLTHIREDEMSFDGYISNEMLNQPISYDEVEHAARKLKKGKACGVDCMPNEVLQNHDVINIALQLFNVCMNHNVLPSIWGKSIINHKVLQMIPCPIKL